MSRQNTGKVLRSMAKQVVTTQCLCLRLVDSVGSQKISYCSLEIYWPGMRLRRRGWCGVTDTVTFCCLPQPYMTQGNKIMKGGSISYNTLNQTPAERIWTRLCTRQISFPVYAWKVQLFTIMTCLQEMLRRPQRLKNSNECHVYNETADVLVSGSHWRRFGCPNRSRASEAQVD